jgi:hypothetical protein
MSADFDMKSTVQAVQKLTKSGLLAWAFRRRDGLERRSRCMCTVSKHADGT